MTGAVGSLSHGAQRAVRSSAPFGDISCDLLTRADNLLIADKDNSLFTEVTEKMREGHKTPHQGIEPTDPPGV